MIRAPDNFAALVTGTLFSQPQTNQRPRHNRINKSGQVMNRAIKLPRNFTRIMLPNQMEPVSNRFPIMPVASMKKFFQTFERFGGITMPEPGVTAIEFFELSHPTGRDGAGDPVGQMHIAHDRVSNKSIGQDDSEHFKTRLVGMFFSVQFKSSHGPGDLRAERFSQEPTALDSLRQQNFFNLERVLRQGPGQGPRISQLDQTDAI